MFSSNRAATRKPNRTAYLPCSASSSYLVPGRERSSEPLCRGLANPATEPSQAKPQKTMPGSSTLARLLDSAPPPASGTPTGSVVGHLADPQTSREASVCHAYRCKPRCWKRSYLGGRGYLNGRRTRTAGRASPAGEPRPEAHRRQV